MCAMMTCFFNYLMLLIKNPLEHIEKTSFMLNSASAAHSFFSSSATFCLTFQAKENHS